MIDFNEYIDKNSMVLDKNKILDGNALLYTGATIVIFNSPNPTLNSNYDTNLIGVNFNKNVKDSEVHPGLLGRYGKPGDRQAHDDYTGVLCASYFLKELSYPKSIKNWGKTHKFCWNNQDPEKWTVRGFFVRQPGFWPLVKACNNEWLNPLYQIFAAIDILTTVIKLDGASGILMDYIKYKVYVTKSWLTHPILRASCFLFKKIYLSKKPKGIVESYQEYFNLNHPLAKLPEGFF